MRALADRPIKKLPTLRGRTVVNLFFEDSTRTRISFEAAAKRLSRRRHQLLGQGLERVQGREPQGHRADAGGDGRGRGRHPPRRRGAPHRLAHAGWIGRTWSTPATAPTSTRPRRCSTRSPCARHLGRASAAASTAQVTIVGDVLHSRVARSNVLLLQTLGAEVTLVAPPTLLPVGVDDWPRRDVSYDLDAALPEGRRGDDAARPARADERGVLPDPARVQPPLRSRRRAGWRRCRTTRS